MRVTDQMINRMAAKSGLPINERSGEHISNAIGKKKSKTESFMNAAGTSSLNSYRKLTKKANELAEVTKALCPEDGEQGIYDRAAEEPDRTELISQVEKMAEGYNGLLSELKGTSSALNNFYESELTKAVQEQKSSGLDGILRYGKDGKLSVDSEKIKNMEIEAFREAFEPFARKISFISERVAQNAGGESSITNSYDASGNLFSGTNNLFDYKR